MPCDFLLYVCSILSNCGEASHPNLLLVYKVFFVRDLDGAIEEMLDSDGPYVLDIMVPYQEHVLPMIPGGMTIRDIIKA